MLRHFYNIFRLANRECQPDRPCSARATRFASANAAPAQTATAATTNNFDAFILLYPFLFGSANRPTNLHLALELGQCRQRIGV